MEERRDPPAEPGSHPAIAPPPQLPAAQQAHLDYSAHVNGCPRCRDIDRDRCTDGQQLWRDWNTACDEAYQRLNDAAG